MKGYIRHIILALVALLGAYTASAQYYSWGADAPYMKWHRVKTKGDKVEVIFPDTSASLGYRMMHYVQQTQGSIDFGFRHGPMKIPFIIHPENFSSNGLVMWLPKRVEILSSPAIDSYSMPWLKQLAAHEYRHAVQYNNINRGFVRIFSYILGQQSTTIGLLFMPLWGMEGDATLSETQMSSFGRALQPSFTMHYRAMGDFIGQRRNIDKWFCGSYREHIPSHYNWGYQITTYANTKYNENIWDKIVRYAVRNPYTIATTYAAMQKYYKTSTTKLARETFADLHAYWSAMPEVEDSSERIVTPKQRSYTTYRYPMPYEGKIISLKEDMDTYSAFVLTDPQSVKRNRRGVDNEERVCYTGQVSTRPTLQGRRLWWSEYRRSLLFAERVNSRLCYVDLDSRRTRTVHRYRNILYPTAVSDKELAWVEYSPSGEYSVVRGDERNRYFRATIPLGIELHSLAYDNYTNRLYFIATSDEGMWIGRVTDNRGYEHVTEPSYTTISDLRAKDGVLYFGSIASGKDEVHCYDLREQREYRISTSKYGSFSPMPTEDNRVLMTTYDRHGYHLAQQSIIRDSLHEVHASRLPMNIVNPPRKQWNTVNLDTVRFTVADSVALRKTKRTKRYHGAAHLFNIHSWAPFSFDPFRLGEEGLFDVNLGATIMSQNLLSTAEGFLSWGWNAEEGSVYKGSFRYYGLGLNLSISATYGGTQKLYGAYTYVCNPFTGQSHLVLPDTPKLDKYYNVSLGVSLPLYLQAGYHSRYLSLSAAYDFSNGLVAKVNNLNVSGGTINNLAKIGYSEGVHLLQFGIGFQDVVKMAPKDFQPKWGYLLVTNYALNPANSYFSQLISTYAKCYLPGFAPHNSISIEGLYQTSLGGFNSNHVITNMSFTSSRLIPRGFYSYEIDNNNYVATAFNYSLPVWYPEGGIPAFLYFKRIRLNAGFYYASFDEQYFSITSADQLVANVRKERRHMFSYGGDISFDVNLFRMPASATTSLTLSLYKPLGKKGVFMSAGLGLPF